MGATRRAAVGRKPHKARVDDCCTAVMEVEEATCLYILYRRYKIRQRRQRQCWVHPILKDRLTHGAFVTLYPNLRKYEMKFFNYFRMSMKSFDELLNIIMNDLEPCLNVVRDSVSPEEKLVITLRYLATGCSFAELHYNYRLGKSTVALVVRQVCAAIWNKLKNVCTPEMSEDMWKAVSDDFMRYANFPNCLGAIDCKHIRIVQPKDSGSLYYNYKHFFSTILLAVCDANYCFLFVDVGAYGKSNDSSLFQNSKFYSNMMENKLNIPEPKPITDVDRTPLPHVFVGDDAFGLSKNILRPYVGKALPFQRRVFNYRLSRARRYIECTFGILANKWRIFHRPLNVNLDLAESIILACCMLHNYVRRRDGVRFEDTLYEAPLIRVNNVNAPRPNMYAKQIRDKFARYFFEEGKLPWQDKMA